MADKDEIVFIDYPTLQFEILKIIQLLKKANFMSAEKSSLKVILDTFITLNSTIETNGAPNAKQILLPFITLFESENITGSIVETCVETCESLIKFIMPVCDEQIVSSLLASLLKCRFEATESPKDELVLFKIMRMIYILLDFSLVSDDLYFSIFQTGFSICFQKRLEDNLRLEALLFMKDAIYKLKGKRSDAHYIRVLELLCKNLKGDNEYCTTSSLTILSDFILIAAPTIKKSEPVIQYITDEVCRQILILINSASPDIVLHSLRLADILFQKFPSYLKFELEYFLKTLTEKIAFLSLGIKKQSNFEILELILNWLVTVSFFNSRTFAEKILYLLYLLSMTVIQNVE